MTTAEQVLATKFSIDGVCCLFAILRAIATRNRGTNKFTIATNVCLFLTFAVNLTSTAVFAWSMIEEQKLIREHQPDWDYINAELGKAKYTKVIYIAHLLYTFALYFLKLSYLAHYGNLFLRAATKKNIALYVAAAVTVICFITGTLLQLLWCTPIFDNWVPGAGHANPKCPATFNYTVFATIAWLNIISDLFIVAVPLLIVSELGLNSREKWALIGIFVIGGSSIIASVVRFVVVGQRFLDKSFTWDTVHVFAVASHAEILFGVLAFCLPSFRVFLRQALGEVTNRFGSKHNKEIDSTAMESRTRPDKKSFQQVGCTEWGDSAEALRQNQSYNYGIKDTGDYDRW